LSQALLLVLQFFGEPTESDKKAIFAYERARQTKVEIRRTSPRSVSSLPAPTYPPYDAELAFRLEAELAAARTAAASLDERRALELANGVEEELRAHPELPQAAWLMAERFRVAERVGELSEAERTEFALRAEALEGPRAAEFGAKPESAPKPSSLEITVEGLSARDRLEFDGAPAGRELSTVSGEHHVRVLRGERLIHAAWVTLEVGATSLALPLPAVAACSDEDLSGVRVLGARALPEPGTSCARWAVARRERGGLSIAECFGDQCGPFSFYAGRASAPLLAAPPPQPPREESSDLLLKVALGGAAVVATTLAILWQGGVFDPEPAPETRWVYGGARPSP
jgi:hypothetical protein